MSFLPSTIVKRSGEYMADRRAAARSICGINAHRSLANSDGAWRPNSAGLTVDGRMLPPLMCRIILAVIQNESHRQVLEVSKRG